MAAADFLLIPNTPDTEITGQEYFQGVVDAETTTTTSTTTSGTSSSGTTSTATTDTDLTSWLAAFKQIFTGATEEYDTHQQTTTTTKALLPQTPQRAGAARTRDTSTAVAKRLLPTVLTGILRKFAGPLALPFQAIIEQPGITIAACQVAQTVCQYITAAENIATKVMIDDPATSLARIADGIETAFVESGIVSDTSLFEKHMTTLEDQLTALEAALKAMDVELDFNDFKVYLRSYLVEHL